MIDRRSIWGVLIGLTICISIWRISVQEPYMLAEYGYNNNNINLAAASMPSAQIADYYRSDVQQQSQQIYGGKHLLARKVHDISDEESRLSVKNTTPHIEFSNTERAKVLNVQNTQHTSHLDATKQTPMTAANSSLSQYVLLLAERNNSYSNKAKSATKVKISSSQIIDKSLSGKLSLVTRVKQASPSSLISASRTSDQHQTTAAINNANSSTNEALHLHLPLEDAHQLIDLHNFDYIMNQPACADTVAALIMVHTAPSNYMKRLLIRKTWGQYPQLEDSPLRLIFLLGTVSNNSAQYQLEQENNIFGDMVQGNFIDTYRNLTYKHAMVLKWFIYNCAQAQILIKMDDDVFLNTPLLLRYFQEQNSIDTGFTASAYNTLKTTLNASQIVPELSKNTSSFKPSLQLFRHPQNLICCKLTPNALVKRSYRSKWRVTKREYSYRYYPPYCPGHSIIYSADVVKRLYKAAQANQYFWIDDVHVTGTLAQLENITITSLEPFMLTADVAEKVFKGKIELSQFDFISTWPDITDQQIDKLWNMLEGESDEDSSDNKINDVMVAPHSYEGFR